MKIRYKLPLAILSAVFAIVACLTLLSYASSKRILMSQIRQVADETLKKNLFELDDKFNRMEGIARGLGLSLGSVNVSSVEEVADLIKSFLEATPEAFGSTVAFQPGEFIDGRRLVAPYFYRTSSGIVRKDIDSEEYDYPKWDWYRVPIETGKPSWGKPYFDEGGGDINMVTYSYPFFKGKKPFGVATVDLSLSQLTDITDAIKVAKTGRAFLVDRDGTILSALSSKPDLKYTIFDLAKGSGKEDISDLGRMMTEGGTGFRRVSNPEGSGDAWIAFGPIESTGWSLGIVFPEDELFAELKRLGTNMLLIATAGLAALLIIVLIISRTISRPITLLADKTKELGRGVAHDCRGLDIKRKDEVGILTRSFCDMSFSLSQTLGELKSEKALLQSAFSNMKDGMLIVDREWKRVVQSNKSADRLFALPSDAPFYEHIQAIFDSEHPISQLVGSDAAQLAFKLTRRESENFGKLHLSCISTPIYSIDGSIKEKLVCVSDTTEQESEEQSKRNFLSLMSHKLFTPLTVLEGKLMLMKDGLLGDLNDKQRKGVGDMAVQSAKLLTLIQSLVNFVTLEGSEFDKSREEIDIASAIDGMKKTYAEWYSDRKIEIDAQIGDGASKISYNKKYFNSIVGQLIENGIKFNMSDPVQITVRVEKKNDRAVIAVTDNGIGIPSEYHDKIFGRFYQIDKYFTGNVEGVGLGLAYVRDILDHFGGSVSVTSEPGKGSTFTAVF